MENKQTAVEWLKKKCQDSLNKEPVNPTEKEIGYSKALYHFIILLEEAKAMEKEQIINAFLSGDNQQGYYLEPELYYEETYGK